MGITHNEALDSLRSHDLVGIGMEADAVRRRLHPEGVVTYTVTAPVACAAGLPREEIRDRAAGLLDRGPDGIRLTRLSELGVEGLIALVTFLRQQFPETWIEALDLKEAGVVARGLAGGTAELIERMRSAGLSSLAEAGVSPDRAALARWVELHRAAHRAGFRTIAAMSFSPQDSPEVRVGFLDAVRTLQEETGGFTAFVAESSAGGLQGPTAVECLKTLAVSRLMLDNIENVQVGMGPQGLKVLEVGLRFGANDAGPVLVASTVTPDLRVEDLRRVIRDCGFMPVERDPGYRMMFVS